MKWSSDGGRGRVRGGASSNDVVEHRHRFAAPSHQLPLILPAERAVGEALDVLAIFAGGNAALVDDCDTAVVICWFACLIVFFMPRLDFRK